MKKKSKSTSTTNQVTHTVQTPNNPEFVSKGLEGLGNQITGLSGTDPYSFVSGADPLQTQAGTGAANLTTSPNYGRAADILNGVAGAGPQTVQGVNIADYIKQFQNPYLQDVVNTSLAKYDQGAGQQQASADLAQAQDSTFGGSGGSILQSDLKSKLALDRGGLAAGLYSNGFDKASSLATTQAANDLQTRLANANFGETALARQAAAAGGLADVASASGDQSRANVGVQASIGDMLRQIAQTRATAPLSLLGTQASLFGGLPLGLLQGQTQDGTLNGTTTSKTTVSDPMGSIGGLLAGAGSLATGLGSLGLGFGGAAKAGASLGGIWSDRRLKRDVVKLGERPDGLGVYAYRYLWSPVRHIGVLAQEVIGVNPGAVMVMPNGYLAVDYGKL